MFLVESLVPKLEVYSIDEAFIDFTGVSPLLETAFLFVKKYASPLVFLPALEF